MASLFDFASSLPNVFSGGASTPPNNSGIVPNRVDGLDTKPAMTTVQQPPSVDPRAASWNDIFSKLQHMNFNTRQNQGMSAGVQRPAYASQLPKFGAPPIPGMPAPTQSGLGFGVNRPQALTSAGTTSQVQTESSQTATPNGTTTTPGKDVSAVPASSTSTDPSTATPADNFMSSLTDAEKGDYLRAVKFGGVDPAEAKANILNQRALFQRMDPGDLKRYNDLKKFDELWNSPQWIEIRHKGLGGEGGARNMLENQLGIDSTDGGKYTAQGFLDNAMRSYFPRGSPYTADLVKHGDAQAQAQQADIDAQKRKQADADAVLQESEKNYRDYIAQMMAPVDANDPEVRRTMDLVGGSAGNAASAAARMRGIEGGLAVNGIQNAAAKATALGLNDLGRFRQGQALSAMQLLGGSAGGRENLALNLSQLNQGEGNFLQQMKERQYEYDQDQRRMWAQGKYAADSDRNSSIYGTIGGGLGALVGGVGGFFAGGPAGAGMGAAAGWNVGRGVGGSLAGANTPYPGSGGYYGGGYGGGY